MIKFVESSFCVFGNPIHHTLSPVIHKLFSIQTGIFHEYGSQLVSLNKFNDVIKNFFLNQGKGANITVPFKEQAYLFSDLLTNRARMSRSVNTLKKINDKNILGDNTDGIGILYDLKRIKFLNSQCNNVLLVGAGGAARGIIFSLLSYGCNVVVINRKIDKVVCLSRDFQSIGSISVFEDKLISKYSFNLIINSTVNVCKNSNFHKIRLLINPDVCCYDINYFKNNEHTSFMSFCINNGAVRVSNGIGMLVSQAAYSFYLWHGVLPEINSVISALFK